MSSQYEILKWGIAGAGKISSDFTTACQSEEPKLHEFVAVSSRSQATAQAFADKFLIPRAYGSYQELANDAEVHAVYVANLVPDHYDTAKLFLEHGKHVLMEKPLTMNSKQTEAIFKLAKEKKLFLMEAIWSRFLPSYCFIREQIKVGKIGKVLHASAEFGIQIDKVDRLTKKDTGGGSILDLGVYTINLVQTAFNNESPSKVVAVGHLNEEGVDLNISAALSYSNGKTATISSHASVILSNEARITGTKGYIKIESQFHCSDTVILNGVSHTFSMPTVSGEFNFPNSTGLRYEAREVRRVLLAGRLESDILPAKDSLAIARIEDEIRKQVGVHFSADQFIAPL